MFIKRRPIIMSKIISFPSLREMGTKATTLLIILYGFET